MTDTEVQFFAWAITDPATLLRRQGTVDEMFRDGTWQPTTKIVDWFFGNEDLVEQISEEAARQLAPAAFARTPVA